MSSPRHLPRRGDQQRKARRSSPRRLPSALLVTEDDFVPAPTGENTLIVPFGSDNMSWPANAWRRYLDERVMKLLREYQIRRVRTGWTRNGLALTFASTADVVKFRLAYDGDLVAPGVS